MKVFRIISVISTVLYGGTLLYCLPRLLYAMKLHSIWSKSLMIQCSLALFTLCEVINSGSFYVETGYNTWGFVFYLIGQFFFVLALTTFSRMWSRFTLFRSMSATAGRVLHVGKAILVVNFISSVVAIGVSLTETRFEELRHHFRGVLLTHFVIIALSLSALAGRMLSYGIDVYNRLRLARPDIAVRDKDLRLSAIRRVNTIVSVLTACFVVRLASMLMLIYDLATDHLSANSVPFILWFVFFNWIPTILPAWMLLFITYRSQTNELRSSPTTGSMDDWGSRSPNGSPSYRPPFFPRGDSASRALLSDGGEAAGEEGLSDDGDEYRTLADIESSRFGGHLDPSVDRCSDAGSGDHDHRPPTNGGLLTGLAIASSLSTDLSIDHDHPSTSAMAMLIAPGSSAVGARNGFYSTPSENSSNSIPGSFRDDNPANYKDVIEKYIIMR